MKKTYHISHLPARLDSAKRAGKAHITYHRRSSGFSLVELMVAMTIIGIISSLVYTNYVTSLRRSRDAKRKADLEQVRSALEMYRSDNLAIGYPAGSGRATTALTAPLTGYLVVPTDPKDYFYYYERLTQSTYVLCACLEVDTSGSAHASCGNNCSATCNYSVENP